MNDITLSIIIPVYNTDLFLKECLTSCITQDVKPNTYEIICVDDGSTDTSGKILDEFSDVYSNVQVYHRENHGVSDTRNYAISKSHGKYIWFVDSDDFIQDNILSKIYEKISDNPDSINLGSYQFGLELTSEESELKNAGQLKTKGPRYLWMTVYNSQIIKDNNILFNPKITVEEDMMFNYEFYNYSKISADIPDVLYFYRTRPGSLIHSDYKKKLDSLFQIAILMRQYYNSGFGNAEYSCFKLTYSIYSYLKLLQKIPSKEYKTYYKQLKDNSFIPSDVNNVAIKKAESKNLNIDYKLFSICTTRKGLLIFKLKRFKYKLFNLFS